MQEHKCDEIQNLAKWGQIICGIFSLDTIPELRASNLPTNSPVMVIGEDLFVVVKFCPLCGQDVEAEFAPKTRDAGVEFF